MTRETFDIYAEGNPAFTAYLIQRFVKKYCSTTTNLPHLSLIFIVVPLSMSARLEPTFSSTNSRTGFLAWISRFPEVRIGLGENITASRSIIAAGLKAAVLSDVIAINGNSYLCLGKAKGPPENLKTRLPYRPKAIVNRAERLGTWLAQAGSPAAIFSALEVRP